MTYPSSTEYTQVTNFTNQIQAVIGGTITYDAPAASGQPGYYHSIMSKIQYGPNQTQMIGIKITNRIYDGFSIGLVYGSQEYLTERVGVSSITSVQVNLNEDTKSYTVRLYVNDGTYVEVGLSPIDIPSNVLILGAGSYSNIGQDVTGMLKSVFWDGDGTLYFAGGSFQPTTRATMEQRPGYSGQSCCGWQIYKDGTNHTDAIIDEEYETALAPFSDVTRLFEEGENILEICFWGGGDPPYTGFTCSNLYLYCEGGTIISGPIPIDTPGCKLDINLGV